jgi:hypothetical protein
MRNEVKQRAKKLSKMRAQNRDRPEEEIWALQSAAIDGWEHDTPASGRAPFRGQGGLPLVFEAPPGSLHRVELDRKFERDEVKRLELERKIAEEEEARQAALDEQQRLLEEKMRREAEALAAEQARIAKEREEEVAALERARQAELEAKAAAEWELTQHEKWRKAGFDFDFKIVLTEDIMASAGYSIGISFLPQRPTVDAVRAGSIGEEYRVFKGDKLMKVNGVAVDQMSTELAVRTLTLAEFPRTLEFHVPKKYGTSEDLDEDDEDEDEDEDDEGRQDEAGRGEGGAGESSSGDDASDGGGGAGGEGESGEDAAVGAEAAAKQSAKQAKPPLDPYAWKSPRPLRNAPKKRPEALVLRVLEPPLVAGEYEVRLAKWGGWFDGPLVEEEEGGGDDGDGDGDGNGDQKEMVWPCMALDLTTTEPNTGCVGASLAIPHRMAPEEGSGGDNAMGADGEGERAGEGKGEGVGEGGGGGGGDCTVLEDENKTRFCDGNRYPPAEELPMIAVAVRGQCTFTDKVRALQTFKHPIWNDELSK